LKRSISAPVSVKREWNESNWKVNDLELVPLDFPLERTHREVQGADASEVAERISKALRLLSVEAEYDDEQAKAKCTTSDMVSFRIRLYAAGEEGLPVVVEVQRRSGSPSSFMRVCRQILGAAEGEQVDAAAEPPRKKMPPFMKGPIGGMKCLQSVPMKRDPEAEALGALTKSMDLLRSKEKDTNLLGLENLCLVTDPLKTRPDIALTACKSVILEESCLEIRDEVGVMLQKDTFLPEEFDDVAVKVLAEKTRHQALVLLSNVLVLTSKNGFLAKAVVSGKWIKDFVVPTLIDEVKNCESGSNNAYEAALGLTSLANSCDDARRLLEENAAAEELLSAYKYGMQNHELLANEADRALTAMGKTV